MNNEIREKVTFLYTKQVYCRKQDWSVWWNKENEKKRKLSHVNVFVDLRRRETQQEEQKEVGACVSEWKCTVHAKREKKKCFRRVVVLFHAQEIRKSLVFPTEEMARSARMTAKPGNERGNQVKKQEEGKMKTVKQIKSRTALPKQTSSRQELKMAMMKSGESKHFSGFVAFQNVWCMLRLTCYSKCKCPLSLENMTKDSKYELITIERQRALLEVNYFTMFIKVLHHENLAKILSLLPQDDLTA